MVLSFVRVVVWNYCTILDPGLYTPFCHQLRELILGEPRDVVVPAARSTIRAFCSGDVGYPRHRRVVCGEAHLDLTPAPGRDVRASPVTSAHRSSWASSRAGPSARPGR